MNTETKTHTFYVITIPGTGLYHTNRCGYFSTHSINTEMYRSEEEAQRDLGSEHMPECAVIAKVEKTITTEYKVTPV